VAGNFDLPPCKAFDCTDVKSVASPLLDVSNEHVVDAAFCMPQVTSKVETQRELGETMPNL
jgi:hypothetical protein